MINSVDYDDSVNISNVNGNVSDDSEPWTYCDELQLHVIKIIGIYLMIRRIYRCDAIVDRGVMTLSGKIYTDNRADVETSGNISLDEMKKLSRLLIDVTIDL